MSEKSVASATMPSVEGSREDPNRPSCGALGGVRTKNQAGLSQLAEGPGSKWKSWLRKQKLAGPHMRSLLGVLSILAMSGVLLGGPPALAQQAVGVKELVKHPARYNERVVTTIGTVASYQEGVSGKGFAYAEFRLEDGGTSVGVFAWEHAWRHRGLRNGLRVRVTGTFTTAPMANGIANDIEAERIEVIQKRGAWGTVSE